MGDIKNLSIFGNQNRGLDKIKKESNRQKKVTEDKPKTLSKNMSSQSEIKETIHSTRFTRSVGAPIKNYDQVYTAKSPLKLSAITVSLTRILSEKYMAENTRDEILRLSLDDYIKHHFTKEDKQDLFNDLTRELELFRENHPTNPVYNEEGILVKTSEQVEEETMKSFIKAWGIKEY